MCEHRKRPTYPVHQYGCSQEVPPTRCARQLVWTLHGSILDPSRQLEAMNGDYGGGTDGYWIRKVLLDAVSDEALLHWNYPVEDHAGTTKV